MWASHCLGRLNDLMLPELGAAYIRASRCSRRHLQPHAGAGVALPCPQPAATGRGRTCTVLTLTAVEHEPLTRTNPVILSTFTGARRRPAAAPPSSAALVPDYLTPIERVLGSDTCCKDAPQSAVLQMSTRHSPKGNRSSVQTAQRTAHVPAECWLRHDVDGMQTAEEISLEQTPQAYPCAAL